MQRESMPLGPRDELVTVAVAAVLEALRAAGSGIQRRALDEAEGAAYLADHLGRVVRRSLEAVPRSERPDAQAEITNRLIAGLINEGLGAADEGDAVTVPAAVLTAVHSALPPGA